jgi:hypothetical protein
MDWAKQGVKIVHSNQLDLNTPQTSGMTRAAAITHAGAGATKLWAGTMLVQPDPRTGPHHHGELETVRYVIKGSEFECDGAIGRNSAGKPRRAILVRGTSACLFTPTVEYLPEPICANQRKSVI